MSETRQERVEARLHRLGALMFARSFCASFGTTLGDVIGKDDRGSKFGMYAKRTPTVCRARHRLWMVLRHTLALSFPELGEVFEVDHTTVMHGVKKCETQLESQYGRVA